MSDNYVESLAVNTYFDKKFNIHAVKVLPGEYYVTSKNMLLVTVLGSCVAACIRDRVSGIGGINHFMLPDAHDNLAVGESARYGSYAMEILINEIIKLGGTKKNLEAKVFGGGNVLEGLKISDVGNKNSMFVKKFLKNESIPIVAEDLLDIYPRKVYFFTQGNRVLIRKLKNMHNSTIVNREKEYEKRLHRSDISGDIELFD